MKVGVVAEAHEDANALRVLIRRLAGDESLPVKAMPFKGKYEVLRKGRAGVKALAEWGATVVIVTCDLDECCPVRLTDRIARDVLCDLPTGISSRLVFPVKMIEAWVACDPAAAASAIGGLQIPDIPNPEILENPKVWLKERSRTQRLRPPYLERSHNLRVLKIADLGILAKKSASFRRLRDALA